MLSHGKRTCSSIALLIPSISHSVAIPLSLIYLL